jgi:hypothetical protein
MIKNQVNAIVSIVERYAKLPRYKSKTLAQFEQERFEMVTESGFQITF